MRIIVNYDDCPKSDSQMFLTKKSGYSELGNIAEKYKLRAVCVSDEFVDCMAVSKENKCYTMTKVQKN